MTLMSSARHLTSRVSRERTPGLISVVAAALLLGLYAVINPGFLAPFQLQTAANQIAPLVLVSLGQLLIVLTGGIDISIAAVFSLTNVTAVLVAQGYGAIPGVAAAVLVGASCGVLNMWVSLRFNVALIVVTLATSFVFGAAALQLLDRPGGQVPAGLTTATSGLVAGTIPVAAVWIAFAGASISWLLRGTILGRGIVGVGSSEGGVVAAGLRPRMVRLSVGAIAGSLTALGAVLLAGSNATGDPLSGTPYLLLSIAAVAFAGADFAGGVGSVWGTVAGSVVLSLIGFVLFFAGITSYWQYVITSGVILFAVALPRAISAASGVWKMRLS